MKTKPQICNKFVKDTCQKENPVFKEVSQVSSQCEKNIQSCYNKCALVNKLERYVFMFKKTKEI